MLFSVEKQLTPSAVYCAAVGMFLSAGYQEIQRITPDIQGVSEMGRVFKKDNAIHVLYFPGKDNDTVVDSTSTALPLSGIIQAVDASVNALLQEKQLEPANVSRHLIVCENNAVAKLVTRNHFVYLNSPSDSHAMTWYFQDSKSKGLLAYDLTPIKNILFPGARGRGAISLNPTYHDIQKGHWECGYYALIFMMQSIGLSLSTLLKTDGNSLPAQITPEIIQVFLSYHNSVPREAEQENDVKQSIAMDDAAFDEAFSEPKMSQAPASKATFFQRHRIAKYALIGLGIGLGLAAAGLALAFAWPVVLPAVGGFIAAHIAVGAMATATVGWLGVGALGLVATTMATSVSLVAKWIKDKVSDKPAPAAEGAAVSRRVPFESSYAKIQRRYSISLDRATVSSSPETRSPLTRSKSSSDLSSLASQAISRETLSLPKGVNKFASSPVGEEKEEHDDIADGSNGRKKTEPEPVSNLYPLLTK
ncbi:MAG TPA: hypothetical protein VFU82_04230 [Gammaproteobacteria bacterium]|nr:hypothetical protein [Gammaproteobacteria bacterium]